MRWAISHRTYLDQKRAIDHLSPLDVSLLLQALTAAKQRWLTGSLAGRLALWLALSFWLALE